MSVVSATASKASASQPRFPVLRRLLSETPTVIAMIALLLIVLMAVFAPWITTGEPYQGSALARLKPIGTPGHWLGTDEIGRDMWTRLAYGGRLSLIAGIAPVVLALIIGGGLGLYAGYAGGRANTIIMRVMDVFYAFPSVLLAVAVGAMAGSGLLNTVATLTIVFVPPFVRVTESVSTRIRHMDFIEAARATGIPTWRIILHHMLGNVAGPIVVYATSYASISLILSAGLSFLGLGVPPPAAEWGQMLNSLRQSIYIQPWLSALPGFMIFVTSMSLNVISDGLRNALDLKKQM
jgi:peptide/nickel transport system permease protein